MGRLFLDASYYIDITEIRREIDLTQFDGMKLFISPLSIHIIHYVYKYKTPDSKFDGVDKKYTIVPLSKTITLSALSGPTKDFEDNVQLHSAVAADCDVFLTSDEKLLSMAYFGKMRIASKIRSDS